MCVKAISSSQPKLASPADRSTTVHVPISTYRIQLNAGFPLSEAQKILSYLKNLGISDCYLSPVFRSRRGSLHGYDTVSHREVNPELGGEAAFIRFAEEAASKGLFLLLDVVPNHMSIGDPANVFWMDVLEN